VCPPPRPLPRDWTIAQAAVVVCDMWDTTHCVRAARRVDAMAPRMNAVLHELRARGALIVHAPDACMDAYADTPARRRAIDTPFHGSRQTPHLDIAPADVVTDDGQEFHNVLEARGIRDVLLMGVHLNICLLSRPYGIRQLVYWGRRPVLCRDLTDAFHRDPRGLRWGLDRMVAHVERRRCPTVTSDQLVGGAAFRFAEDR
jgi:nicotinamidase-related amidase